MKKLTSALETTFVHFRQHNAPYGNREPPQKRAFSSSDEYKALFTLIRIQGVLVQIVQMHHILERKK